MDFRYTFRKIGGVRPECKKFYTFFLMKASLNDKSMTRPSVIQVNPSSSVSGSGSGVDEDDSDKSKRSRRSSKAIKEHKEFEIETKKYLYMAA